MSCKLTPRGAAAAARNLSIRTRLPHTLALQRIARSSKAPAQRTPFLITRRGLSDDINSRPPPPGDNSDLPPPPPQEPSEPSEVAAPGEYVPRPPEIFAQNFLNEEAIAALQKASEGYNVYDEEAEGLLFDKPEKVGKNEQLQNRYHPVVDQVTKLLMKDGKLSKAQRHMTLILNYLRTNPAPKVSPLRPLLPGSPPPSQLPLNPLLYLTLAIESVAPIIRIASIKGAAGGGHALEVPEPLAARPRRRTAIMWIIDAVLKKRGTGSGRAQFATRFAQEIVAVVEGRSGVWQKREAVHKLGTASRANLTHRAVTGAKMGRSAK
ncbi:ribosomal protein S7 [Annulohypoxylon maeteangense]|uniref:ribosomal protein S7 n=1 Tax=Annulohypoxylon maeteangense TaxID=1927788 RepID=UPI002008570A|nr:ribosomal protein S7 [Annulohypoxylon maeteangense]KAI0888166.1 ribosomal protein S7 [Annulohypoxylon maeteangense]